MTAAAALLKAALKELFRDRTSLSFVILMPLLFVVFFGLAYRGMEAQTEWGGARVGSLEFLLPGVLGLALMWLGLFAAIPLAAERELGILRRFATVPVPRVVFVFAQVGSRLLLSLVQMALIVAAGWLLFGVSMRGHWALYISLVVLGGAAFVSLGYAVAALVPTQQAAHGWAQMASAPMLFLSGVFFPFESLPAVVWPLAQLLPLTHLVEALRQVSLASATPDAFAWHVGALVLWAAAGLLVSVRYFRWT